MDEFLPLVLEFTWGRDWENSVRLSMKSEKWNFFFFFRYTNFSGGGGGMEKFNCSLFSLFFYSFSWLACLAILILAPSIRVDHIYCANIIVPSFLLMNSKFRSNLYVIKRFFPPLRAQVFGNKSRWSFTYFLNPPSTFV